MKLVRALIAVSALSASAAMAADKTPNCEVKGKKEHVKNQKACEKKKGTWLEAAAAAAPAEAAPAAAAPAAPAAEGEMKK